MTNPVPGYAVSTPYHKTGSSWKTCGWHTGQDYAAPAGTPVVAARAGTVVRVDYGSSLGEHQFVVRPGDGTEDFYAHCSSWPADGLVVMMGTTLAVVGSEGNATGPHLHFERHNSYGWQCSSMADPMLSHNYGGTAPPSSSGYPTPTSSTVYLEKLHFGQDDSDSVWYLQDTLNRTHGAQLPTTGGYWDLTDSAVRKCQSEHGHSWGEGSADAAGTSFVGERQASHIFAGSGLTVVP